MRSPKPAASTIAVFGTAPGHSNHPMRPQPLSQPVESRDVAFVPGGEGRQLRMAEGRVAGSAIRAACDGDIAACRRAYRAARKCRGSWWRAAPPWSRRSDAKAAASNAGIGLPAAADVAARTARARDVPAHRRGHPAAARRRRRRRGRSPRPGNRAGRRARCPGAAAARSGSANGSRAAPRSAVVCDRRLAAAPRQSARNSRSAVLADRKPAMRDVPVEQQFDLDQESREVVGRDRVRGVRRATAVSSAMACACSAASTSTASRIARVDRRRRRAGDDSLVAEILQQQKALFRDRRRRSPAPRSLRRAGRPPSRRTASRPRRDGRWRCRACRRAPADRPAGAARSSGSRACRRALSRS